MNNRPILRRGDNPSVVLHNFVKKTFKDELRVEVIYSINEYFDSENRVRVILPDGRFHEATSKSKKGAKRKACQYIIKNWDNLVKNPEWVPEDGFWSLNSALYLRSCTVGSGFDDLIEKNNCFIDKPTAYWVAAEIRKAQKEIKNSDGNWSPEVGEEYYYISNLDHVHCLEASKNSFWGCGEFHRDNKFKTEEIANKFLEKIKEIFKEGRKLSTKSWIEEDGACEIDYLHRNKHRCF